jgi:ubiquitin conjugation factor E4 B
VKAVSRDERSYQKNYFSRAASILLKHGLKYRDDIDELERFVNKVEISRQEEHEEEDELGDIPDEYIGNYRKAVNNILVQLTEIHTLKRSHFIASHGRPRCAPNFQYDC